MKEVSYLPILPVHWLTAVNNWSASHSVAIAASMWIDCIDKTRQTEGMLISSHKSAMNNDLSVANKTLGCLYDSVIISPSCCRRALKQDTIACVVIVDVVAINKRVNVYGRLLVKHLLVCRFVECVPKAHMFIYLCTFDDDDDDTASPLRWHSVNKLHYYHIRNMCTFKLNSNGYMLVYLARTVF